MKEKVFLNGKLVLAQEATLPILSEGLLYGFGLFESMRWHNNRTVYFAAHLERIKKSAVLIGMGFPYKINTIKDAIRGTISANHLNDAYVRLSLWKSYHRPDLLIVAKKYSSLPAAKYQYGFSAAVSAYRQNENSFLSRIKSANRVLYELSFSEAKKKGFDEAVILNSRGYIAEASRSNIFMVRENTILTPAISCGCLAGITRRIIFDLAKKYRIKISEGNFTINDLLEAQEAFLTNSLMGVMPLTSIEKHRITKGRCAKITKFLTVKYGSLLR